MKHTDISRIMEIMGSINPDSKKLIEQKSNFFDMDNRPNEVTKDVDELNFNEFETGAHLEELRNALQTNKTISVAFVKKDNTVRHMAVRRYLKAYVGSDAEKTDRQQNIEENNNIKYVIDMNIYIKTLRETGSKEVAAKKAWRAINLENVLGFMAKGKFYDLREENNIMERYGEEIYNSLTKSMTHAMEQENAEAEHGVNELNESKQLRRKIIVTESQLKRLAVLKEYNNYNYPAGADADSSAPWHENSPMEDEYEDFGIEKNKNGGWYVLTLNSKNGGHYELDLASLFPENDENLEDITNRLDNLKTNPELQEQLSSIIRDYVGENPDIEWEYDEYEPDPDAEYDDRGGDNPADDYVNERM